MAVPSFSSSDFQGAINLSQITYGANDLNLATQDYTVEFLRYFLGNAAYTDIAANDRGRWNSFFGGTTWEKDGATYTLFPVRDIMLNWIWARWIARQKYINSSVGTVENFNENSELGSGATIGALGADRMAYAAQLWCDARAFLYEFRETTETIISAVGASPVTVTVETARFLENGDTVTINNQDYTASNVSGNTFQVDSASSAGFNTATWKPFELVATPIPDIGITYF